MLVLTRKLSECIVVPNCELAITIIAIEGNQVRLGISAPAGITVYREEIWRKICQLTARSPEKEERNRVAGFGPSPAN